VRSPRIAMLLAALAVGPALAQQREVDTKRSQVSFTYTLEKKITAEGAFPKWRAEVAFDDKQLAKSSVRFEIELAAIATGSSDSDNEAVRAGWFDVANHPLATFVSDSVRKLADDRYEAVGKLTIKGNTRDASIPFTLFPLAGGGLVAQGKFIVQRLAFGVGDADTSQVADEVEVQFNLVVGPAK
jgi:polyisoprenoid-binding protein YceI